MKHHEAIMTEAGDEKTLAVQRTANMAKGSQVRGEAVQATSRPMQFTGWDLKIFLDNLRNSKHPGICDALSGAWLSNMVEPGTDSTMGIDKENFDQIKLLKMMFDLLANQRNYHSSVLTTAFVAWAQKKKMDSHWLKNLSKENFDKTMDDFKNFIEDTDDENSGDEETASNPQKKAEIEDKYEDLTEEKIYDLTDDLLESFFGMTTPFTGLVIIKAKINAKNPDDDNLYLGHQFAVKYEPIGYKFSIFDQNVGLSQSGIDDQDMIGEIIANHVHKGYVANPMRKSEKEVSTEAKITLLLTPGG
jgi:hypothetical protein